MACAVVRGNVVGVLGNTACVEGQDLVSACLTYSVDVTLSNMLCDLLCNVGGIPDCVHAVEEASVSIRGDARIMQASDVVRRNAEDLVAR